MFNDLFKAYAEEQIKNVKSETTNDMSIASVARNNMNVYMRAMEDMGECNVETGKIYVAYVEKIADWIVFKINSRLR